MTTAYPWERRHGATPLGDGTVEFRVWAPERSPQLELRGERHPLAPEEAGFWSVTLAAAHGDDYRFVLDGDALPDPATRWQPDGLRGSSRVVDPRRLARGAGAWHGVDPDGLVLYELHVGTFTAEGTFDAAIPQLAGLAELGVTAIELMPVAEFPGHHGWGYDGVYISAAQSSYGGPEGLARLVAAAHDAGLGVILDAVYNHLGASGVKAMEAFGPYFTAKHETWWGKAINYDDEQCDPVREWVLQSAEGWVRDFGIDGLRLDAIHAIYDDSARPIVSEIAARVHAAGAERAAAVAAARAASGDGATVAPPHAPIVIAESALNDPKVIRPQRLGGWGCDAQWADEFHHAIRVVLTGEREGYYADFGELAQIAKAFQRPFVFDGDYSPSRRRRFGAPALDRPARQFVVFSANHDQVGNRAFGDRLPREVRPLAAFCVLLAPFTPMLFMGEEYGEDAPFLFFSDHIDAEIAIATREGRRREFAAFAAFSGEEVPDPQALATFERSKLTRAADPELAQLYRDLLRTRRELGQDDVDAVELDPLTGCLRVHRGEHTLLMNFGAVPATVPAGGDAARLVLATHPGATELRANAAVQAADASADDDAEVGAAVELPALSGALVSAR
ncbi:malto-oligosyltrehalose trehalohydrolase [Conexibacter sp. CPCC 206217]|uniref:malto-oligosyltrehalose trehalohydrolase n=1 Tax=Conexibacter sp. CPCC 206217 TaxID=3064574 RepID=UPI00271DBC0B|nr:malto-oligosyltrehalose trehalohydrolase [Conexibacter sp. CPCC 206217]MDO8213063.1 malto-oligosyltrehalose trehalohydrolase [Conexibacter sp. CPCC 206217]